MNESKTKTDVSSDLTATTEHYENLIGEYPLPFPGDVAEILLSYAREAALVHYQDCSIRDIDDVVVKRAAAPEGRPIASRSHDHIGFNQERGKRLVDGVPKPIFHQPSGRGFKKMRAAVEQRTGRLRMQVRKVLLIKLYAVSAGLFPNPI
jgi:hypothetical protein